jgi:thymidylate synthase (FAD)
MIKMKKIDVLNVGYVGLVSTMGNDLEVANAARVSFDKRSELDMTGLLKSKDKKLIDFLWKEEHTSPFRHCVLSFEIYAPLMVARQHWKYAVASTFVDDQNGWNESSRRYITEEPAFYIPTAEDWRSAPENSKQGSGEPINYGLGIELTMRLFNTIEAAEKEYQNALDMGVCAEQARLFLPAYGMYVRYRWTTSLHGVMHFLQQRLAHDAQKEITDYALAMKSLAGEAFPYSLSLVT